MLDIKLTILKLLAEAAVKDQNQDNCHDYQLLLLCPILFRRTDFVFSQY